MLKLDYFEFISENKNHVATEELYFVDDNEKFVAIATVSPADLKFTTTGYYEFYHIKACKAHPEYVGRTIVVDVYNAARATVL